MKNGLTLKKFEKLIKDLEKITIVCKYCGTKTTNDSKRCPICLEKLNYETKHL